MSQASQAEKSRGGSRGRKNVSIPGGSRGLLRKSHLPTRPAGKPDERPAPKEKVHSKGPGPNGFAGAGTRGGIRIYGRRGDPEVSGALVRYAAWLRKKYRFPVRVPVYLLPGEHFVTSEGKTAVSSFFAPFDRAEEPYIRIATGDFPSLEQREGRDNALAAFIASLSHEIIYYWQWIETGTTSERGVAKAAVRMLREYEKSVDQP